MALGLHPEIVERKATEQGLLISSVAQAKFIGEIGLDGSQRFRASLPLQEEILSAVISECARQGGRVMSLHSRGANARVLNILEQHPGAGTPILHWFSGTPRELQRAIELGCWFSVGPAMLEGAKGRDLLSRMPADKLLPETDGPFTAHNGTPLMPWQALDILPLLSEAWRMPVEMANAQLVSNLTRLLSLI